MSAVPLVRRLAEESSGGSSRITHGRRRTVERARTQLNATLYTLTLSPRLREKRIVPGPWGTMSMPSRSHFPGFDSPDDELRWNHAQFQASTGEHVLLASMLRSVRSPHDLIKSDNKFRWFHRLSDVQLDAKGKFDGLDQIRFSRAPIAKLGYRRFAFRNHEGDEVARFTLNANEVLELKNQQPFNIPRKFVGVGLMDENWGWLSSYFLNRSFVGNASYSKE